MQMYRKINSCRLATAIAAMCVAAVQATFAEVQDAGMVVLPQGTTSTSVGVGDTFRADAITIEAQALVKEGDGTLETGPVSAMVYAYDYNPGIGYYGLDFADHPANITVNGGAFTLSAPTAIDTNGMVTVPFIHFDASAAGTLTTLSEGGRTRVSAWRDPVTQREATGGFQKTFDDGFTTNIPMPFLIADALNGKPVVDFGRFVQAENGQKPNGQWYHIGDYDMGESGALRFQDTAVRELFMVVRTNERRNQPFYLGSEYGWVYSFSPEAGGIMGYNSNSDLRNGEVRIDGRSVRPYNYVPDQEFHVVALSPCNDVGGINTISLDRHCRIGGMALGEILIYNTTLTVAERRAVEAYLMRKWFDKPHPLAGPAELGNLKFANGVEAAFEANRDATIGVVDGSGTFTKSGAGNVTASGVADTITGFTVTGGSLAFAASGNLLDVTNEASFHIDPSIASTLTMDGTYVTRIDDVRSSVARYAETSTQSKWAAAGPTLVPTAETGLNLLDFGAATYENPDTHDDGTCGMKWNQREQIYTFCLVVEKKDVYGHDSFILGDTDNYDFHGDDGNLLSAGYSSYLVRPGQTDTDPKWPLDGVEVNPTTTPWTTGPHVITMTLQDTNPNNGNRNGAPWAGMFSQDRNQPCRIGGMRYGEVLVFTNTLSQAKVKALAGYLMEKWLGAEKDLSGGLQNLEVAAGSTFSYEGDIIIADDATIDIGIADGQAGVIDIDGEVILGEDVALTIGTAANPAKGMVPVLRATTFGEGAAEAVRTWTLNGGEMRFLFDGGTLYANFGGPGTYMLMR